MRIDYISYVMIDNQTHTDMKVVEQNYWSIQNTQDGIGWTEMFQFPYEGYSEEATFDYASNIESNMKTHPQFYRVVKKSRKLMKL